jgi:tRNA(Ile)-lysidine synthase
MIERLVAFIEWHKLLEPEEAVVLGYSGGADSTCLLHLLKQAGYKVVAAHLHHGQRKEADEEMERCEKEAEKINVPFVGGKADVPAIAHDFKIGIEEAGRRARYEFFAQVSASFQAKIATAHSADDNFETMLLHIVRGTGFDGVAGIPVRRGSIIRPFLWARRDEARQYCEQHALWFHDDPANEDERFARVAIRNNVVPALEAINPRAVENGLRLSTILREDGSFLDSIAAARIADAQIRPDHPLEFLVAGCEVRLSAERLRHSQASIVRRGVRLIAAAMGASPDFAQCQAVADAIHSGVHAAITFEGGSVVAEAGGVALKIRKLEHILPYRQALTVPGETICDDLGWSIAAWPSNDEPGKERRSLRAMVDSAKLSGRLYARPFKPGDRVQPFGARSESKVQDLLTNAHVSAEMKKRLPIICDMIGPIWIPTICIADRAKVSMGAGARLNLELRDCREVEAV